jgi:hypothetical protein
MRESFCDSLSPHPTLQPTFACLFFAMDHVSSFVMYFIVTLLLIEVFIWDSGLGFVCQKLAHTHTHVLLEFSFLLSPCRRLLPLGLSPLKLLQKIIPRTTTTLFSHQPQHALQAAKL